MIGVTAFHTDFLQSHVCGCKITAGGVDSLSSDIVTDTHALFLFKEGTQISRADIGFAGDIVTEYGMVNVKGLSTWQKAEAIISVAHPDFRDELIKEAEKMHIWRRSNK